jgi:putative heme-binding domain-containing protein
VLADTEDRIEAREKAAIALGTVGNREAIAPLVAAVEKAPARLQTAIALGLAAKADGAAELLKTVAAGKASARLLQDRAIQTKLFETKLPRIRTQIDELSRGLPSADQRMLELISKKRDDFNKHPSDGRLGVEAFKKNCANCHQIRNEGAKIGPQLDGIGGRGLDRLLEDIFDPSRNVDQAFRTTVLAMKDGRNITGLLLREEGAVYVLADAQGKDVRINKDDVDEKRLSLLSPMPANFSETIKDDEFRNLLAYLLSQRAKDR